MENRTPIRGLTEYPFKIRRRVLFVLVLLIDGKGCYQCGFGGMKKNCGLCIKCNRQIQDAINWQHGLCNIQL